MLVDNKQYENKLIGIKFSQSYFEISWVTIISILLFVFLDTLTLIISIFLLIVISWIYISKYSNSLYYSNEEIIISNVLNIFNPETKYKIGNIKEIDINSKILERRKWNLTITDDMNQKHTYFFQYIGQDEITKLRTPDPWGIKMPPLFCNF